MSDRRSDTRQEQTDAAGARHVQTPSAYVSQSAEEAQDLFHIVCEDLFKIYKIADLEVVALRGLDLRVRRGELMAVVGSSGSGKSTLLNVLAGLDLPSAGAAYVNGKNLIAMTEEELVDYRRREVGFVWQQTGRNLIPYLSAEQNVEIPLVLNGTPRKQARRRARELLESVGLTDKMRSLPQALSGGEQQRVSISVALANGPSLLLADEPTGELDTHTSEEIFELFAGLNKDMNVTVIVVTHDPAIAARVDRVVAIRDGRIATETFRHYEYAANGERTIVHREYAVVDRAGRLQIPKSYMDALDLRERARVLLADDHVTIFPEDAGPSNEIVEPTEPAEES